MKSYLSLIPISAKVHKRQSRMTLLCIVFAVFMVTAVFSMAEMGFRMEQARLVGKHGNFSIGDLLGSSMGQSLLSVAVVLFLLILIAGVLMISSSMNSSVAQRVKFFGMMRCIGMSKQQIIRFVRLEALNWCKTAVPIGLILGVVTTWGLCAVLHFVVREEFSNIPLFGISLVGIACGIFVGVITVLIAANAPAKRASKVSPIAAVSGNTGNEKTMRHSAHTRFGRIETILGINHAISVKKNLILMTGSFALSIILFLSFSVMVNFVDYLIPQSAATSDIDIASADGNSIPHELLASIREMDGVKEVYGRRSIFDVPAGLNGDTSLSGKVDLISYDDFDLQSLKKDGALKKGSDLSKVYGNTNFVLATSDVNSTWEIGDEVRLGDETLTIAGLLKNDPFSEDGLTNGKITLITSSETFVRLTGDKDYSLVLIQTTGNATDENVRAIQNSVGETYIFRDKRDERTTGTYMAFVFCVYAFLTIIALVTVLNIVNSISMSVSARMKQYGAMRAVGMDERQITKMIACEAFTYATLGCIVGCGIGLPLSKMLYGFLITGHFPSAIWQLPITSLAIILLFVSFAAILAVYAPAKRIKKISVTETINEL
ncbi:MAG: FtsX-like permease family protein [Eubacteriales bacterium]|nr:FtsX-like permease family protein [Eubacteriales bacterium]